MPLQCQVKVLAVRRNTIAGCISRLIVNHLFILIVLQMVKKMRRKWSFVCDEWIRNQNRWYFFSYAFFWVVSLVSVVFRTANKKHQFPVMARNVIFYNMKSEWQGWLNNLSNVRLQDIFVAGEMRFFSFYCSFVSFIIKCGILEAVVRPHEPATARHLNEY